MVCLRCSSSKVWNISAMSGANMDIVALKRVITNILDRPMFSSFCDTSSANLLDLLKPEDEGTIIL